MTDYFSTYQQFQLTYNDLVTLIDTYPKDRAEESGALGVWSPKQIIAHLSGWVTEATQRYRDISQGIALEKTYDNTDAYNAESVESRDHLSWDETIEDFKHVVTTWFTEIESISAVMVARDPRFSEWLTAQNREFRNHTDDLRHFIKNISAMYPILEFDSDPKAMVEPATL